MTIVCKNPCLSLTRGGIAVTGEELILPLSALGARLPLTRSSHPPPPWISETQFLPWNLYNGTIHANLTATDYVTQTMHAYEVCLCSVLKAYYVT